MKNITYTESTPISTVKIILGITKPKLSVIHPIRSPPTKAPRAWPTSIRTILKRRFSGGLISAIYAKQAMKTTVEAPVKPCRRPVRTSIPRLRSNAMTIVEMAQAITWTTIWGTMAKRRPRWSLIVPMINTTNIVGSIAAIIIPLLHIASSSWKAASLLLTLVPFCPRKRQASLSVRFSDTVFVMLYSIDMRSWMYCCVSGAKQVNMVIYIIMTGSTVNHRWPNWNRYSWSAHHLSHCLSNHSSLTPCSCHNPLAKHLGLPHPLPNHHVCSLHVWESLYRTLPWPHFGVLLSLKTGVLCFCFPGWFRCGLNQDPHPHGATWVSQFYICLSYNRVVFIPLSQGNDITLHGLRVYE